MPAGPQGQVVKTAKDPTPHVIPANAGIFFHRLEQIANRQFPQFNANRNRADSPVPVEHLAPEHFGGRERPEPHLALALVEPARDSRQAFALLIVPEKSARKNLFEHPPAAAFIGGAEHALAFEPEGLPEHPHERPARAVKPETAQQARHFLAVVLAGTLQQRVVIHDLLEPDSARQKMPLDMRKLHRQRKLQRRHVEAFRRKFRIPDFAGKVALESFVRKGVVVPRRGLEMHLDLNPVTRLRKVHMVAANRKDFPRLGVEFVVGPVSRKEEGFKRDGILRHHPEILQQGNYTLSPALDPDVDIAALPDKRIWVKPRVGGPLQYHRPPALRPEDFREFRSLAVHHAVMPANSLGLARPLKGKVQRRLPVLRQALDPRIGNAHHCLF